MTENGKEKEETPSQLNLFTFLVERDETGREVAIAVAGIDLLGRVKIITLSNPQGALKYSRNPATIELINSDQLPTTTVSHLPESGRFYDSDELYIDPDANPATLDGDKVNFVLDPDSREPFLSVGLPRLITSLASPQKGATNLNNLSKQPVYFVIVPPDTNTNEKSPTMLVFGNSGTGNEGIDMSDTYYHHFVDSLRKLLIQSGANLGITTPSVSLIENADGSKSFFNRFIRRTSMKLSQPADPDELALYLHLATEVPQGISLTAAWTKRLNELLEKHLLSDKTNRLAIPEVSVEKETLCFSKLRDPIPRTEIIWQRGQIEFRRTEIPGKQKKGAQFLQGLYSTINGKLLESPGDMFDHYTIKVEEDMVTHWIWRHYRDKSCDRLPLQWVNGNKRDVPLTDGFGFSDIADLIRIKPTQYLILGTSSTPSWERVYRHTLGVVNISNQNPELIYRNDTVSRDSMQPLPVGGLRHIFSNIYYYYYKQANYLVVQDETVDFAKDDIPSPLRNYQVRSCATTRFGCVVLDDRSQGYYLTFQGGIPRIAGIITIPERYLTLTSYRQHRLGSTQKITDSGRIGFISFPSEGGTLDQIRFTSFAINNQSDWKLEIGENQKNNTTISCEITRLEKVLTQLSGRNNIKVVGFQSSLDGTSFEVTLDDGARFSIKEN